MLKAGADDPARFPDVLIAGFMSQSIVNRLKTIQVEQHHGKFCHSMIRNTLIYAIFSLNISMLALYTRKVICKRLVAEIINIGFQAVPHGPEGVDQNTHFIVALIIEPDIIIANRQTPGRCRQPYQRNGYKFHHKGSYS